MFDWFDWSQRSRQPFRCRSEIIIRKLPLSAACQLTVINIGELVGGERRYTYIRRSKSRLNEFVRYFAYSLSPSFLSFSSRTSYPHFHTRSPTYSRHSFECTSGASHFVDHFLVLPSLSWGSTSIAHVSLFPNRLWQVESYRQSHCYFR